MTDRDAHLPAEMARRNWIILAVLVLLSLLWRSAPVTLGVLTGGLIVTLNYHWMGHSLRRLLADPRRAPQNKGRAGRSYLFRLLVMGLAIYVLLAHIHIHPLGLIVGLSVYVVNLLLTAAKRLY
ncbi:MAG: ATP synthase subunit I [Pelovirga sp.]|jgi:hypothetical protein